MIIREENEITDKIQDEDLAKADIVVVIHNINTHTNPDNKKEFELFLKDVEKQKGIKIVYVHKYLSENKITLGVKRK